MVLRGISCTGNYYSPNSIIHYCDSTFTSLYFFLSYKPLISVPHNEIIPHPTAETSQELAGAQDHHAAWPFCGACPPRWLRYQRRCHRGQRGAAVPLPDEPWDTRPSPGGHGRGTHPAQIPRCRTDRCSRPHQATPLGLFDLLPE